MGATSLAVVASELTKSYGSHRGIVEVNLELPAGEILGLVGANGAGKTTLMRVLLDFIRPSSGSLSVFGLDSVRDSVEVRKLSTYLPGELVVPPRLTGEQILERFAFARPSLDPKWVASLTERFDLDLSRRFGELSKGNKQKVGLVLAFAPSPRLLVLDEPTSGLDPLLQREFGILAREAVGAGATIVLSSHVMSEVERIASKVALMQEGRVVAVDDVANVFSQARRWARIRPRSPQDSTALAAVLGATENVSDLTVEDGVVVCACTGDMDSLIKAASGFAIETIDVAHADLEDTFFEAYAPSLPSVGSS